MSSESAVRVAVVYPDLLGTYGDTGNALVLEQRLRWRGIAVERVRIGLDRTVPNSCDVYVLGGGEDASQLAALTRLQAGSGLTQAVQAGASVFAVCAGMQILGTWFTGSDETRHDGLGLLDVSSVRGSHRSVGEVVSAPLAPLTQAVSGFANHRGVTHLGPGARPLGHVVRGPGNGTPDGAEGAVQGAVTATYLHGPVLARNPELADAVLSRAVGELAPLPLPAVQALRERRMTARRHR